jgi:hypothetical protein
MSSLKRLGIVLSLVAALGVPSTASALSISNLSDLKDLLLGWSQQLKEHKNDWNWYKPRYPRNEYPKPERGVPEPTAALLFGLGAVVVAARSRKSR